MCYKSQTPFISQTSRNLWGGSTLLKFTALFSCFWRSNPTRTSHCFCSSFSSYSLFYFLSSHPFIPFTQGALANSVPGGGGPHWSFSPFSIASIPRVLMAWLILPSSTLKAEAGRLSYVPMFSPCLFSPCLSQCQTHRCGSTNTHTGKVDR